MVLFFCQIGLLCSFSWFLPVRACFGVADHNVGHVQVIASPAKTPPRNTTWRKIALKNVKVFDGTEILPPSTVIIDGARIGLNSNVTVDEVIDGNFGVLLPGLIDSHLHPSNTTHLEELVSFGVTTSMSMACQPEPVCNTLRGQTGLSDFYSAGNVATSPNSTHANLLQLPPNLLINSLSDASWFVSDRIGNGSDYIKLVAEPGGMTQQEHNVLVYTAHSSGMQVMTHTGSFDSYQQAIESQSDIIQHISPDRPVNTSMAQAMLNRKQAATPILTIILSFINNQHVPGWNYSFAQQGVRTLYEAGVPILAGTDAHDGSTLGVSVPFGSSLHSELELLQQAGLPTLEILRAATERPARHFGLLDRGIIKPGYRADLVLIEGDPIANISNTRNIQRVWAAGIEYKQAAMS
ncbi:hypothetical protein MMC28_005257 [Mycoblastus sanguinarius]|nr:hypothetical protein [Mycoblastus sanguinarius]